MHLFDFSNLIQIKHQYIKLHSFLNSTDRTAFLGSIHGVILYERSDWDGVV